MRQRFPTTLEAPAGILRDGQGASLARSGELAAAAREGKIDSLIVTARVFLQKETPNRNFIRFKPSILRRFAASFKGVPFLADHKQRELSARGGTILSSELVEVGGGVAFDQQIELVKPWAIESALDGTLDRFSIGWNPTGPVLCTACGEDLLSADCAHMPGDELEDGTVVEAMFTAAEGVETSAVNVPAVPGTGVRGVQPSVAFTLEMFRASVSDARKEARSMKTMKALAAALFLSADEPEEKVVALAIAEIERGRTLLEAEREAHSATKAELAELRAAADKAAADRLAERVDALVERAKSEGKIRSKRDEKGAELQSAIERAIRLTASGPGGFEAAEEYVAELPAIVPVGQRLSGDKPVERQLPVVDDLTNKYLGQLGCSEEDLRRFGPKQ